MRIIGILVRLAFATALGGFVGLSSAVQAATVTLTIFDDDPLDGPVTASGTPGLICVSAGQPPGCHVGITKLADEILSFSWIAPSAGAKITSFLWFGSGGTTLDGGNTLYVSESLASNEVSDTVHLTGGGMVNDTFYILDFSSVDGRTCPATGCDTFEGPILLTTPAVRVIWSDGTIDMTQFRSDIDPQGAPEPSTALLLLAGLAVLVLASLRRRAARRSS